MSLDLFYDTSNPLWSLTYLADLVLGKLFLQTQVGQKRYQQQVRYFLVTFLQDPTSKDL